MNLIHELRQTDTDTMLDYVQKQSSTLNDLSFNEVDSVLLAQLAYVHFQGIIGDLSNTSKWTTLSSLYKAELFDKMFSSTLYPQLNKELFSAMCASPRFRDIQLNYCKSIFDEDVEQQFFAITYLLPTNQLVIAFRGTDSTMTGWKENFNMAFKAPVPSQISAKEYVQDVTSYNNQNLYILGHSKGGNLAVYSAISNNQDIQAKIINVYDLDGPGFYLKDINIDDYQAISQKTIKIMPEGSIIGIIMESIKAPIVIKSANVGIMQHETYSWLVLNNQFIRAKDLSGNVKYIDKTVNGLLYSLSSSQRETFFNTLFKIIYASKAKHPHELVPSLIKEKDAILEVIKDIDPATANCIKEVMKQIIISSMASPFTNQEYRIQGLEIFK